MFVLFLRVPTGIAFKNFLTTFPVVQKLTIQISDAIFLYKWTENIRHEAHCHKKYSVNLNC